MSVKKPFRKTWGNRETSLPGWRGLGNDGQHFCLSGVWGQIFSGSSLAITSAPGWVGPRRGPSHLLRTGPGSQVRLAGLCWEFELDRESEELKMFGNASSWRGVLSSRHLWGEFPWFPPPFWGLGLHAGCWFLPFYKPPHSYLSNKKRESSTVSLCSLWAKSSACVLKFPSCRPWVHYLSPSVYFQLHYFIQFFCLFSWFFKVFQV